MDVKCRAFLANAIYFVAGMCLAQLIGSLLMSLFTVKLILSSFPHIVVQAPQSFSLFRVIVEVHSCTTLDN